MDVDGYLPLVFPAVAALAARPLAERLPPRTAAWVLTALAAGLALAAMVTLTALDGGAVVAVALGVAALFTAVRQVRDLRAVVREARGLPGHSALAVIDDDRVDAYAVPGRVVVSTGMLATLTPAERRVLFAHEIAHLTGRHHIFRAVVRVASAANPLLWPLRSALWYATERWADERAAVAVGDRGEAARAIGKAALARRPHPGTAMGIGTMRPGPVPRRVTALLRPPPRRRLGLTGAAVGLLLWSGFSANDLVSDLPQHGHCERTVVATATWPR
jgi:beta-lactamase regulating signal transducer with metallopeptidase domain